MTGGDTCAHVDVLFLSNGREKKRARHNELLKIRAASREADNRLYERERKGLSLSSRFGSRAVRSASPRLRICSKCVFTENAINRIGEYVRIRVKGIPRIRLTRPGASWPHATHTSSHISGKVGERDGLPLETRQAFCINTHQV